MRASVQQYANGAAQSASLIMAVANFLAPPVNVPSPIFQYQTYSLQNRFRIPDTKRAIGGQATQVQTGGVTTQGLLEPYALDYPVDEFERLAEESQVVAAMNEKADITAQLASLDWSKKVVDLALTTAGSGTDKSAATSGMDFIDEIDQQIIAVAKASQCGELCPVKVLIGPTAFRRLKNHSSTKDRFKGGKRDVANPTLDDIMGLLIGNPATKMSWITYDSADQGATAAPTFLLDNAVLIFASSDQPTRQDPSFMKTFRLAGQWMKTGVYEREDGRGMVYKTDWYGLPAVANSTACVRLNLTA